MVRGTLCVIGLLLTLSASLAQPALLESDPLLQRRITVWLKMEPMHDALRQIGRQTGVTLRCIDAIAEEKVAIFVEDRPAHEILSQLAKVFRYEWRKHEDGGYMLYVPDETRLQEEKMANAVREARRQALRDIVQVAREIRRMSFEQRIEEQRKAYEGERQTLTPQQETRRQVLNSMTPYKPRWRSPEGEWVETGKYYFPSDSAAYHCLAALPDRMVEALLNGQTVGFSTKPASGVFLLPNDALLPHGMRHRRWTRSVSSDGQETYNEQTAPDNPEFAGVWLRMCPRLSALEYQLISVLRIETEFSDEIPTEQSLDTYEDAIPLPLSPYLGANELWSYWEGWATPEEQLKESFPDRPTPRDDRPAPPLPRYRASNDVENSRVTTVDALEHLAWAMRRPVISDAFRATLAYLYPSHFAQPRTAVAHLLMTCWLRADDSGYLLARHKHYYSYRRYELPESWLRPLEQKYSQQGWLELDDYIALAAKLTSAQVEFFVQGRHYWYQLFPLTGFEFEPLASCLPALRFLASLNAAQRQQLAMGQWLPRRRLSTIQQRCFQEAVGDRFPPAQQLFRDPIPDEVAPETDDEVHNLFTTRWTHLGEYPDQSTESPDDAPREPAVRLLPHPEQLNPFVLASEGYIGVSIRGGADDRAIQEYLQRELDEDPGSRLMAARLRRHRIEFWDEQGQRRVYEFVLSRYEPYTLPPPKPEEKEQ